ncbi:FadR/GntR family transcriptional regulator [Paraburkholderia aromaticivorans]|uniref:FadR/GntR family transcriptional regulator n=1 Tax=Paraburkholderia aromaticivorans TaxID=2026199 RepID=UPI001F0F9D17|nr:GntR family transcriptional regulator [Paraburkholderia aromaticivorans]
MNTPRIARRNARPKTEASESRPSSATGRQSRSGNDETTVSAETVTPFGPITTRRISEEIGARIREQIAAGMLPPGARLPTERELSEQFAVSRMAVREGMRNLEVAGLIILKKGRHGGAFVNESSAKLVTQQIRDMIDLGRASLPMLMEARFMVMDMVVRLASERATAADIRAMEANLETTEILTEAGRFEDRTFTAITFNKLLADATRNYILGALVEGLSEVLRHLIVLAGPRPIDSVVPLRRKLIEQIRMRDADGAAATMRIYLEETHSHLMRQSRKHRMG